MTTVTLELPENLFQSRSPEELGADLRLAAAILWYEQGRISQERASELAGLTRSEFLDELARQKLDVFVVDFDDLDRELERD